MNTAQPASSEGNATSKDASNSEESRGPLDLGLTRLLDNLRVFTGTSFGLRRLRGLVLDLAMRGLLNVGADRGRAFSGRTVDDDAFALPAEWDWTTLGDTLLKITDGTHHSPPNGTSGPFMYVTAKNIKPSGVDLTGVTYVSREVHEDIYARCDPHPGDILLVKDGATTGVVTINHIPTPFSMLSSVALLRPSERLHNQFLLQYLRSPSFYNRLRGSMKGVAITRVTLGQLAVAPLPLPPLAEQKRLVARVDELMRLLDDLDAKQAKQRETQVHLRSAALDALTSAERPEDIAAAWKRVAENFEVLFERPESVEECRKTILSLAVLGKLVPPSPMTPAPVPGGGSYEPEFDIPPHWNWGALGRLCRFIDYRGRTPKKTLQGVRLVTAKNVGKGVLRNEPREFIAPEAYDSWMSRGLPQSGDVLFTTEAPLGSVAQLLTNEKIALAQRIITLHPIDGLDPAYLKIVLMSPPVQGTIRRRATGTTAQGIKAARLKLIPFPVPPLTEQRRIVAKVERLMKQCDDLEAKLQRADETAGKLVEAVVAELVAA